MSNRVTERYVADADEQLSRADVPLHARPFQVVLRLIRETTGGDILVNEFWAPVEAIYRRLYPSDDFSIPPMLIGGVGLRDRFYLARINVGYGTLAVRPLDSIAVPKNELETIWRLYPQQGWRAIYAVTDLWDFAYGTSDLRQQNAEADPLWRNAGSSIEAAARMLAASSSPEAVIQSACLTAELALKGALAYLGVVERERRRFGHKIHDLAGEIARLRPAASDTRLLGAAQDFPDYVDTRYADHGLTRVQLTELAMRAQYVAAEALRRVSDRNLAGQIEGQGDSEPRTFP